MVHYGLTTITLLVASLCVQAKYLGKREVDRDYYTLNIPNDGLESAQHIARSLNVRLEGPIGELDDWYMVSSPKPAIEKRAEEDQVLSDFHYFKSLHLNKRDGNHWQKAQSIDKQVLKKRTKRGPIPRAPGVNAQVADAQRSLGIADPWFNQQWHLVSLFISSP